MAEFKSFKDSLKDTTRKRRLIEDKGEKSDIVVLKGIETGSIVVEARFKR